MEKKDYLVGRNIPFGQVRSSFLSVTKRKMTAHKIWFLWAVFYLALQITLQNQKEWCEYLDNGIP